MEDFAFDTSVLSAFALVERSDLLEHRYKGRAAWTVEVHKELTDGLESHPRLSTVLVAEWLGAPHQLFVVDQIEEVRLRLGGRPRDLRHLGEASTIILGHRLGCVIALDDYDATKLARARGLETVNTLAILRGCVRDRQISAEEAVALRNEMVEEHDRRLPSVATRDFA